MSREEEITPAEEQDLELLLLGQSIRKKFDYLAYLGVELHRWAEEYEAEAREALDGAERNWKELKSKKNIFAANENDEIGLQQFRVIQRRIDYNSISVFPRQALYSVLLLIVAHYEDCLRRIELSANRFRTGKDSESRLKKRLKSAVDLDFSSSEAWNSMNDHQKIRNLVAHNGGVIDDSDAYDNVRRIVNQSEHLDFQPAEFPSENEKQLVFGHEYVHSVIQDAYESVSELLEAIPRVSAMNTSDSKGRGDSRG